MFIRIYNKKEQKEILVNTDRIWKIEVKYGVVGDDNWVHGTTLKAGVENPEAVRSYWVFVGDEHILLPADPGSKVCGVIEEIYRNAVKD